LVLGAAATTLEMGQPDDSQAMNKRFEWKLVSSLNATPQAKTRLTTTGAGVVAAVAIEDE